MPGSSPFVKRGDGSAAEAKTSHPSSSCGDRAAADLRLNQTDFLKSLFRCLEREQVRYCVLQRWDALQEELATDHDIDLAVHPRDASQLSRVFGALWRQGYQPIQFLNHAVNAYALIFGWLEGLTLKSVMVDITFEHRQCGLIWKSGEELVAHRQRPEDFWVAAPETEFSYLLVKKLLKNNWRAAREHRFGLMVERMGDARAERVIGRLFGEKKKKQILEACGRGSPGRVLRPLRRQFLWRALLRNPFNLVRYAVTDSLRLGRRFLLPTGATLALSGKESARKSALLVRLVDVLTPAFGSRKVYWGPGEIAAQKRDIASLHDSAVPEQTTEEASSSPLELLGSFARFWSRYIFRIRPLLVRTGLVVFDSHFLDHCLGSDRKKGQGSNWLAQILCRLVPQPDLLVCPDALENALDSNAPTRSANGDRPPNSNASGPHSNRTGPHGVAPDQDIDRAVQEAAKSFLDHMSRRFQSRHSQWLSPSTS